MKRIDLLPTAAAWPDLRLDEWRDTRDTLHMWTQIVGKVRLELMPWMNHSWHVPLYVSARGLTTSPIPVGGRVLQIDFDFVDHRLLVATSDGGERSVELRPRSVADFYREVMASLAALGVEVTIDTTPSELADGIPFDEDEVHASYDAGQANRFWRTLVVANSLLLEFRAFFMGKCSPVHFFWGGFDLAVTRFSGRPAPPHPGGVPNMPDWVARDAYSHEVSSAGWWPGGAGVDDAAFYSYMYPEPAGFPEAKVEPEGAYYHRDLREFVLPYQAARAAADPSAAALAFLESTYRAGAALAGWDPAACESPWADRSDDPRCTIPQSILTRRPR